MWVCVCGWVGVWVGGWVGMVSLAAPRVCLCSGSVVLSLNITHEAEPLGRN